MERSRRSNGRWSPSGDRHGKPFRGRPPEDRGEVRGQWPHIARLPEMFERYCILELARSRDGDVPNIDAIANRCGAAGVEHVLCGHAPNSTSVQVRRLPLRSTPRSAAKPRADGADALVACGRRKIASVRGPHSRSFAREPPAPDFRLTARTSPILAGRVRGARGLRSPPRNRCESLRFSRDFQAARAVPHTARPRRDWPRSGCAGR